MKSITCPSCRFITWATDETCKRCGAVFAAFQPESDAATSSQRTASNFDRSDAGSARSEWQSRDQSPQANSNPKRGLAIASMVLGILSMPPISLMVLGVLVGLLIASFGTGGGIVGGIAFLLFLASGLVAGIVSVVRANKRPREYGGKGFAIAGIVLSSFALVSIPVVAAIAIPNLLAARRAANEGSAISTLRTLQKMQAEYMTANGGKCGDINTLQWDRAPQNAGSNVKSGYHFAMTNIPSGGCELNAMPTVVTGALSTGIRSFFMSSDDGWTIRAEANNGRAATRNSETLERDQISKRSRNDY